MLPSALLLLVATYASAHNSLYDESMFGWRPDNYDLTKSAVTPLRETDNLPISKWFHRFLNYPPAPGKFMEIRAGGSNHFQVSCSPHLTTLWPERGRGKIDVRACPKDSWGAMHQANAYDAKTFDMSMFGGTALSIAYTSDFAKLKPEDLTVISVNYTSTYDREQYYHFPKGMPACPPEGCICGWHWIHSKTHKEGYGDEMYFNAYRCKVTGAIDNNNKIGKGVPAVECSADPSKCKTGPKQPMFLWMTEGNNVEKPARGADNPFYNMRYGWKEGAQQDAVVRGNKRCVRSLRSVADSEE